MRAARYEAFSGPIEIIDLPDPVPPSDGVVISVEANGVCRSDWHAWVGHDSSITLPHVPGHEMAGTVVAVGPEVSEFAEGDRVTAPFVLGCGICGQCRSNNQQVCERQYQAGFDGWGAFAEFVALPYADVNLVRLPETMAASTAAGLGCRFSTAFRAVVDQGQVGPGGSLAVWGCGGVGLSAVMVGAALGAEVYAVDINDDALELARRFGAVATFNASDGSDVAHAIRSATDGGADVSIDALGSTATSISSIRSLRVRGRHIQVGLMLGDDAKPSIPMWRLHANEIELYGSHGMPAWRYPAMLEMVADGTLDPQALVTRTLTLSEGADHLRRLASFPGTGFAVITDFSD